jgi:hypothetical protein
MISHRKIPRSLLGSLSGVKGDFDGFREALGNHECSTGYTCVNRYGYMGRYQFGSARLNELQSKYPDLPPWGGRNNFINDPDLQEQYFYQHVQDLAAQMQPSLAEAQSRYGTGITLSGLIAAAHLKGPGGARQYVHGHDNSDANGTTASYYATQMSGYDIPGYDESETIVSVDDGNPPDHEAQGAIPSGLVAAAIIGALLAFAG